jgi:eukaryotic-like serine/threonine-protein kinase
VQQTARLTHPNTVTVYDYGHTREGVFYYAMELLEGATLEEVVKVGGILPDARVVSILGGVAGALAEAHGIRLVHRDIKPSNVMLCDQGGVPDTPKVLDFGLVRDLQTNQGVTETGAIAGSPAFMSPEAIRAPDTVGPASDLYALGAVGYYLLTAQHVFEGRTMLEVCSHHLLTPPMPPSQRRGAAVHPELERLIMRCLQKDPAQRPASAVELQSALRALDLTPAWSDADARRWWQAHRPSIELRRKAAGHEATGPSLTLQVDRTGRN